MVQCKKVGRSKVELNIWQAAVTKILSDVTLPNTNQLKQSCGIGNTETAKGMFNKIIRVMRSELTPAKVGERTFHPIECDHIEDDPTGGKARKRRWSSDRLYADVLDLNNRDYKAVITCKIEHDEIELRWKLSSPRFAVVGNNQTEALTKMLQQYYSSPHSTVAIYTRKADEIAMLDTVFEQAGFLFCYWLDKEPFESAERKKKLMQQQLKLLKSEIDRSEVLLKQKRTGASIRIDDYLGKCAVRYMYLMKYGDKPVHKLTNKIISELSRT